ncbi:N-acetylmuramoyl-L-alanine amidase [uncultured Desulfovibrio sp.]|uniref:N-acetylmuramoyl-L-alanine amidase n=1 Tax=uncultured Desulfovibrio sp. TaxID=167968 RepID=UPI00261C2318|nr:N-acetylmuramoyl-L-alanine amidase [uncultured Desulfovibrio sp.]
MAKRTTSSEKTGNGSGVLRRLAPPLAFMLALFALVVLCYDAGYSALPPTEKRYADAKAGVERLKLDEKRSMQREPWENLAEEFSDIYRSDTDWPNRAAALFKAGESLEQLARRSFTRKDAQRAVDCYEEVALKHADSRLADDALFRAALLTASYLKDDKAALALLDRLERQYPRGDMRDQARELRSNLTASLAPVGTAAAAPAAQAPAPEAAIPDVRPAQRPQAVYQQAKAEMDALRKDKKRSCWREPWEKLEQRFLSVHAAKPSPAIGAGALYRAAVCREALARCSHLDKEFQAAVALYAAVPDQFPRSALADDALYQAAVLSAQELDDAGEARRFLSEQLKSYAKGDMAGKGRQLLAELDGGPQKEASVRTAQRPVAPELQMLSWDSPGKNSVEVVLELNTSTTYDTRLVRGSKSQPDRLVLRLKNTAVADDVRKGVKVNGSLLQNIAVKKLKKDAQVELTFREVARFDTDSEENPSRIVVRVTSGKNRLPRAEKGDTDIAEAPRRERRVSARQVADMASQLGLSVQRVFIDAGHGGRDPGTSHNKVVERVITLDIALRLGRLLEANGLDVVYSRRDDRAVGLSQRTVAANRKECDLFVSIHVNANEDRSVQGFETYYLDFASNQHAARVAALENARSERRLGNMQSMLAEVMLSARVDESRRLASDIQRLSLFRLKRRGYEVRNNGTKSAPFHVLLGANMPAVLVEVGYCTHGQEAKRLLDAKYRHALAEGLAEGILAYRDRLSKRRTAQNSLTDGTSGAM